jgi:exopolysaccharide biosynthesis polyprenyl glycosylphosphotransferase
LNKRLESFIYIASDYLASALAWTLFYIYRKELIEPLKYGYQSPISFDKNYFLAIILIPLYWIAIYWIIGNYKNIYRKSRVKEIGTTLTVSFLGTVLLFFILLLDDVVDSYQAYRYTFITLLTLQFVLSISLRMIHLTRIKNQLKKRVIGFNTLLVGNNQKALDLYKELENAKYSQGYIFKGFVTINGEANPALNEYLTNLGRIDHIKDIIRQNRIEEVILAVETSEHHLINNIINTLEDTGASIKIVPDMYDIVTGTVKMNYIFGTALIEVTPEIMPAWQKNLKRIFDIVFSALILVIGSPFYLGTMLAVRLTSRGPVFYSQERVGKNGVPFKIFKFRSMYVDAENAGPQLSSKEDPRITGIGKVLRKYRLDEFPQFWNVLIGDMSIVGPRPERQYFIDRIMAVAPHYTHLLKVKPGITSWGQIKFGYAENVDQMVQRMKFDLLYVENMSLAMDFKIIFYTVLIMVQGRGK